MSNADFPHNQEADRDAHLNALLASPHPRKLIVAGPGTGKTHAFQEVVRAAPLGNKLALTFIRRLVEEMNERFGNVAEVRTFHSYCKLLLHQRFGDVDLVPFLTQVIEEDARAMRAHLGRFKDALQTLQVASREVAFYLARGDYYRAVSFDDSVYRVLRAVSDGTLALPLYSQIVIDELQDFNPLEVMLIDVLQERGPILIVGDDDQAVYSTRNASPQYLRDKYHSGYYETHQLPYCSRSPRAIVEATASFVAGAVQAGALASRIPRPYLPYLPGREQDNARYPRLITATTANTIGTASLIRKAVGRISEDEIAEAREGEYFCVLVVAQKQYLNPLAPYITRWFPQAVIGRAVETSYALEDGYQLLLADEDSNLAWRLLSSCDMPAAQWRPLVSATRDGTPLRGLLPLEFISKHSQVLRILRSQELGQQEEHVLSQLLPEKAQAIVARFFPPAAIPMEQPQQARPTILLSSFEGCKGLSAGHVFVVGLNDGEIPRPQAGGHIPDIEYSKFIVAMTRARKSLFLISNRRRNHPSGPMLSTSPFVGMIPQGLRLDAGYLVASSMEAFLDNNWPVRE